MNINDFIYKNGSMTYEEKGFAYSIIVETGENDTYEIVITANKKGRSIRKKANQILSFLKNHLYEHPRFRLESVTKEKKELCTFNNVEIKEYQYYGLEIVQLLCMVCLLIPGTLFHQTWALFIHLPLQLVMIFYLMKIRKPYHANFRLTDEWEEEMQKIEKRTGRKLLFSKINAVATVLFFFLFLIRNVFMK